MISMFVFPKVLRYAVISMFPSFSLVLVNKKDEIIFIKLRNMKQ